MNNNKRLRLVCDTLFLLFSLTLLLMNSFVWKWVESLSLFIPDTSFFHKFLNLPGGVLAYLGCFLTQTLYYPVVGCLVLVMLLFVVQRLTSTVFQLTEQSYPLSFIPSLMLLTAVVNMGYTWITIKAMGHFFAPTLGCCYLLLCALAYSKIKNIWLRLAAVLAFAATYPLFGFYALCATGLCILLEWRRKASIWQCVLLFAVGIIAIWLTPKICYYSFDFTEQEVSRMYLGGMPDFFVRRSELMLWMPFILLTVSLALFSFVPRLKKAAVPLVMYAAALVFTCTQVYMNDNFEASVRENLAIDRNEWSEVLRLYRDVDGLPTRDVVLNGELAALMLGQPNAQRELPDIPYYYKDSRPGFITFLQLSGLSNLYYQGQANLCYRWSMEMSVEYGWRVANLKHIVKCCLVQGEYALADKYNGILRRTAFHKDWAERYQRYIDNPALMEKNNEFVNVRDAARRIPDAFID